MRRKKEWRKRDRLLDMANKNQVPKGLRGQVWVVHNQDGDPAYGAPSGQPGYGQAPPSYNSSYDAGYAQPLAYSGDGAAAQTA
ncbi:hypothetical protein PIB30_035259 [Stylosanthes scabra]|uniref:Uncharacterized protein n=1 Tax=Stylosanthes scabra TaxID=79078 RepID=A0ABU6VDV0_9FABA|nr:hypothetical protein [Stylosanthes scabra]